MRELELGDKTEILWMVSLAYDLCDEECITQIVQEEQQTPKGKCRGEVARRIYHDSPLRTFDIGQTAMLTLHAVPKAGGTQSVSYGGAGMNASEGMHHKDAVINVGTLKDSDIGPKVERMVNSLKSHPSQAFLYFDIRAPEIDHSVDSRMNEVGTRAPGLNLSTDSR